MSITHGMNVEEVKQLGGKLKTIAGQIEQMMQALNTQVEGTSWVGPDATQFKSSVWPNHRGLLQKVSGELEQFGQTAIRNAAQQEQAASGL